MIVFAAFVYVREVEIAHWELPFVKIFSGNFL
jgi:hypothetical protein